MPENPVTIEQTAKRWKLIQAVGVGICVLGLACGAISVTLWLKTESTWPMIVSAVVMGTGISAYLYGTTLAWWHHG